MIFLSSRNNKKNYSAEIQPLFACTSIIYDRVCPVNQTKIWNAEEPDNNTNINGGDMKFYPQLY